MRGVSERVGGPGGVGCGEQRLGRRRSQDALAQGPAPRPRGEAAAGAGRRPPPQQLAAARGASVGGEEGASGGDCRQPG